MELRSVINNNNIDTNIISAQNRSLEDKRPATNKVERDNSQNQSAKSINTIEKRNVGEEEIINAIEKANKKFQGSGTELSFSVHAATKQIMIKIIDKNSKEIVKEIPSEKILDLVANAMETTGLIIDKKM